MAEHKYGITDPEVLSAIACHTSRKTGDVPVRQDPVRSRLHRTARDKAPNLPKLRRLAFEDLDEALYQIWTAPAII